MQAEPDREVQDDADHRRGDRRERGCEAHVIPQPLDVGSAEEDPEEARQEGRPRRDRRAERGGEERRQRSGMLPRADEADELQHHDERPRRRLGEAQAIEHLAGLEPAVMLHRLLRDVWQHGIRAAESDERGLAEKQPLAHQRALRTEPREERPDRNPPQREPDGEDAQRAPQRGPLTDRRDPARLHRAVPFEHCELRRCHAPADPARHSRAEDDDGEGDMEDEERDERARCERVHRGILEHLPADADGRRGHDGEHRGLEAVEQRSHPRQRAEGHIGPAQRPQDECRRQHEKRARNDPAASAMQQPAHIGRELLRLRSRQEHAVVQRV